MNSNSRKTGIIGSVFIVIGLVYFIFLSHSGMLEQKFLESRINNIKLDIERLEVENRNLKEKYRIIKDDNVALEMEARKFYLLSENAYVIKFKESTVQQKETVLAENRIQLDYPFQFNPDVNSISVIRFFYLGFAFMAGIGIMIRMKN